MCFAKIMEALGSDDGREVALELDSLREEGVLVRAGNNGEWALGKSGENATAGKG